MAATGGAEQLRTLLTPEAVRERAHRILEAGLADELPHFCVAIERLPAAVDLVLRETRDNYPDLRVPPHSRWRHFELAGRDLWRDLADAAPDLRGAERARARFDLAVVSVLLDAGAGDLWRYRDDGTGQTFARSEGLAVASLRMFATGGFSSDSGSPLQADAAALEALDADALAAAFQVDDGNPLTGLEPRADLLNRFGRALAGRAGEAARPGLLFDTLSARVEGGKLCAREILVAVLELCNGIWPHGVWRDGIALGDVGVHSALATGDATHGLVPFHKLSQWLSYSLVEPLEEAGITVENLDQLTGLAEYRNGGLFMDTGILRPRNAELPDLPMTPDHEAVVEWRALTVALLDRLADELRARLDAEGNGNSFSLSLAAILQGGTWATGRKLAAELRGGRPPLTIVSDGTVF